MVVKGMGLIRKTWVRILVWLFTSSLTWEGISSFKLIFLVYKIR